MKRKEFIRSTSKAVLGLAITNSFLSSCISKGQNISDIIGKKKDVLKDFEIDYTGVVSCYSTKTFKYSVKGEKIFVFCINDKIVGFSIKMKDSSMAKAIHIPNEKQVVFDNAFGSKTVWKEQNLYKSLCIPKNYKKIENYIFYSEYLKEASSVIW